LGGGSILGGLILGAIPACIINRNFPKATGFALAGGLLTFFGFMHGERIGFAQTLPVAISYLAVAGVLAGCSKFAAVSPVVEEMAEPDTGQLDPAS
jgi:AGZA family xanthine/uracil permease-like MFS transporter